MFTKINKNLLSMPMFSDRYCLFALLVCAIASIIAGAPLALTDGWFITTQGYRYPFLMECFFNEFISGTLYPRWIPTLMGGFGYPTFIFYPPAFWFLSLPLMMLPISVLSVVKLAVIVLLFIGGAGVWHMLRQYCTPLSALFGLIGFYCTPYLYFLIYWRGAYAELTAMIICPWVVAHLMDLVRRINTSESIFRPAMWLSVCSAGVIYSHTIVTIWLVGLLALSFPWIIMECTSRKRLIIALLACGMITAALSAPYWQPVLELAHLVTHEEGATRSTLFQTLKYNEIFNIHEKYFGILHPVLACLGFLVYLLRPLSMPFLAFIFFSAYYMTPAANPLRENFPVLGYLQWPGRLIPVLSLVEVMGIGLLGQAIIKLTPKLMHIPVLTMIVALMILVAKPHYYIRDTIDYDLIRNNQVKSFKDMTHTHEFTPKTASIGGLRPQRPGEGKFIGSLGAEVKAHAYSSANDMTATAEVTVNQAHIKVQQFYFPGWKVSVAGDDLKFCPKNASNMNYCYDRNGLIDISLPTGTHEIRAYYEGVPHAGIRNLAILIVTLIGYAVLRRLDLKPALNIPEA